MDTTLKRQVVMVDKDFEKITYEDNSGNVKGTFETFHFASSGSNAPYNEGRGENLVVTEGTKKEKIPLLGFRRGMKIEQDTPRSDPNTRILFVTPQTRQDEYGMLFCVRFFNDTEKADELMFAETNAGSGRGTVDTTQNMKGLGSITVNGVTYWYYLLHIAADSQSRDTVTIGFNFTSSKLKNGKMILHIYEGFTFNNFDRGDYNGAGNIGTTSFHPYPHQKDFDKHKFQDVMSGDVLLAGTKQDDGTVTANDQLKLTDANLPKEVMSGNVFLAGTKHSDGTVLANGLLRLTGVNLRGAIPFTMTPILPYNGLATNTWSVVLTGINTGYPAPLFPSRGTGQISIRLLTHIFDNDSTIPTSNFTLQYRLIAYKESNAGLSRDYHLHTNISYTNDDGVRPVIKRSGRAFYLNRELTYTPPSDCFGYSLEFKQVKPTTPNLGNESILTCLLTQAM